MTSPQHQSRPLPAYNGSRDQSFANNRCFLCGTALDGANRTDEHVFPQWLLRRCELWNQKLTLLNGTEISYAQIKIPCCFTCNNIHLSPIENRVGQAFKVGPEAVRALDRTDLFVGLSKVYYGLLILELDLVADRADPRAGNIMIPEWVERFKMHHMLMQVARGVVKWQPSEFPASIFVFECQVPNDVRQTFDYADSFHFPFLSIRVGNVGIVASLQDWRALEHATDISRFTAASRTVLHPQQWRQIEALGLYMVSLFDRTPSHVTLERGPNIEILTLPIAGLSGRPLFRKFELGDYAQVLAEALQHPLSDIYNGAQIVDLIGTVDNPRVFPFPADEWARVTIHNQP